MLHKLMPAVSVIIPNYNHGAFLHQRIESVLSQTFQDIEIILLDDHSTDNSREIIEAYRGNPKMAHIVFNDSNSGSPFKQWRKGLELSRGKYVWIAESDDWAFPDFLKTLYNSITQSPDVGICFSGSNWIDDMGETGKDLSLYHESFCINGRDEVRKSLVKYCSIQNVSAALINKSIALKHIRRSLPFRSAGDWLLYTNILMEANLQFVGKKLNNFRWYHDNTSNKAATSGLSITEGLKVLAVSDAYKIKFSRNEMDDIFRYWLQKPGQYRFPKNIYYKGLTYISLSFFYIKCLAVKK
ncbi:MAG: glycosyltransferase family 2 protein [Ferruginibacter sp.]